MAFGIKGVDKLSQLTIDADKDWQGKGITNLKQLAAAMAKGDIVVRGNSVLQRLQPGSIGNVLTSGGPLHLPSYMPPTSALAPYYPAPVELNHVEVLETVDKTATKTGNISTVFKQTQINDPTDLILQMRPEPTLTKTTAVAAGTDQNIAKTPNVSREISFQMLVSGFSYEHPAATITDETAAAQNATANDMDLCHAALDECSYFAAPYKFNKIWINLGTSGVGNWAWVLEYWNGAAWVATTDEVDGTAQWMGATGLKSISHTPQVDWAQNTVSGLNAYWLRVRVTNFVNVVTVPKGTQCWYEKII